MTMDEEIKRLQEEIDGLQKRIKELAEKQAKEKEPQQEQLTELRNMMQQVLENSLYASKTMLTISDVAQLMGTSKSSVYSLTSAHQIPFYKPNGKCIYFDRKDVEDWMRRNRQMSQEEAEQKAAAYVAKKKLNKTRIKGERNGKEDI